MRHNFAMYVDVENRSGRISSVYFRVRDGRLAITEIFDGGKVMADYSREDELLGIQVLGPSQIEVLERITANEPETRAFVRSSTPAQMAFA